MPQSKNINDQLAEIDDLIAAYKKNLKVFCPESGVSNYAISQERAKPVSTSSKVLQVEILKLELKKEKLQDKIVYQRLKDK